MNGIFHQQRGLNIMSCLTVNIRFNSIHSFPVTISPEKTILDLKKEIATKQNISPLDLRIILAGQSLRDNIKISDSDIGNHSVLHALEVRSRTRPISVGVATESLDDHQRDVTQQEQPACHVVKKQFYVYCKSCRSIRSGKLRVKCETCGNGLFLVDRGPSSWEDVLNERRMTGQCQLTECPGRYPKFYFRCGHHESTSPDETAIALHHIKPNSRLVECITCSEKSAIVMVFPCSPGHVICLDCFQNYGVTKLNNRMFVKVNDIGYTLPCPAGCPDSCIQEVHHFHLLGDDQYERYQRFSTEQFLLSEGGVLCPRPGCGNGLMPDTGSRKVSCPRNSMGCGFEFCKLCFEEYHEGLCGMVPLESTIQDDTTAGIASAQRSQWEAESREIIQKTTKPCPKCQVKTERSGGCMHMTCSQCKFPWCWLCVKEWNYDCQGAHWFQ